MQVASRENQWVIPPQFGLWIPAQAPHRIRMPEPVSMRTLYLRPGLADLGGGCAVLHVGPLLRELILEIVRTGDLHDRDRRACALRDLFLLQLGEASPMPTGVRLPEDARARAVAETVIADPAGRATLAALCKSHGIGVRTLERVFRRDIGTSFEDWRRQVRLMKAIELLVAGHRIKAVAFAVGYQEPSTFVALFRSTFGTTPKAWVAALQSDASAVAAPPSSPSRR